MPSNWCKSGRAAGLYVNLITSGIGLAEARLEALVNAGLDHIQLSFQDSEQSGADEIAGTRAHAAKLELAQPHPQASHRVHHEHRGASPESRAFA